MPLMPEALVDAEARPTNPSDQCTLAEQRFTA